MPNRVVWAQINSDLRASDLDHPAYNPHRHEAARLLRILGRLREHYADMTLVQAMVFLSIAAQPDQLQREIHKPLGISSSLVSRVVAHLGEFGDRHGEGAMHLVESYATLTDRRGKFLRLTGKGHELMAAICRDFHDGHPSSSHR